MKIKNYVDGLRGFGLNCLGANMKQLFHFIFFICTLVRNSDVCIMAPLENRSLNWHTTASIVLIMELVSHARVKLQTQIKAKICKSSAGPMGCIGSKKISSVVSRQESDGLYWWSKPLSGASISVVVQVYV